MTLNPQNRGFQCFFCDFRLRDTHKEWIHVTKWLEIDKITCEQKLLRLSRVSWAFLKLLVPTDTYSQLMAWPATTEAMSMMTSRRLKLRRIDVIASVVHCLLPVSLSALSIWTPLHAVLVGLSVSFWRLVRQLTSDYSGIQKRLFFDYFFYRRRRECCSPMFSDCTVVLTPEFKHRSDSSVYPNKAK